jgi:predicted transcriptional regulator
LPQAIPDSMDSIAEIRKRRISLGISLVDLSKAVGRSDATLSRIERGRIRPSYELVQKVLKYLEDHEGHASPQLTVREVLNSNLVTVDGSAGLSDAASLMERGGFSQLPVLEAGRVTGSVSESTILRALASATSRRLRVRDIQEAAYPVVDAAFPADLLAGLFTRYPAVLVAEKGQLRGIVTKTDLIRGLRGTSLRRPAAPNGPLRD